MGDVPTEKLGLVIWLCSNIPPYPAAGQCMAGWAGSSFFAPHFILRMTKVANIVTCFINTCKYLLCTRQCPERLGDTAVKTTWFLPSEMYSLVREKEKYIEGRDSSV